MSVQQTSLLALIEEQPRIPYRQNQVRDVLAVHHDMTNNEIAHALDLPINQITGRVKELRQSKVVTFSQKRPCKYTGKLCNAWRLVRPGEIITDSEAEI